MFSCVSSRVWQTEGKTRGSEESCEGLPSVPVCVVALVRSFGAVEQSDRAQAAVFPGVYGVYACSLATCEWAPASRRRSGLAFCV